jgi:TolB-like protein
MRLPLTSLCIGVLICGISLASSATPANEQILVLPFSIAPGTAESWIGKGMQQELQTDLARGTVARVVAPASLPAAADSAEALEAARRVGATMVVFGQVQRNGMEVRLSGQVMNVAAESSLGSLKATGPLVELFHLEDAITGQTMAALPPALLTPAAAAAMSPPPPGRQQPSTGTAPQPPVPNAGQADAGSDNVQAPPAAAPAWDNYDYSAVPVYAQPTPLFSYSSDYGCAIPAYTYACPPWFFSPFCGLSGGFGFIGGFDRDRDRHGRDFRNGAGERNQTNFTRSFANGATRDGSQSGAARSAGSSSSGVFRSSNRGSYSAARSTRGFSGGSRGGSFHSGGGSHGGGRR